MTDSCDFHVRYVVHGIRQSKAEIGKGEAEDEVVARDTQVSMPHQALDDESISGQVNNRK